MATGRPIDQDIVAWRTLMQAALESMDEGFTVFDTELRLLAWNRRFLEQYDFGDEFARVGTRFEDFMRYNAERGEYGPGDVEQLVAERVALAKQFIPHSFERMRPDGRIFEIRGNPIPGIGWVTVYKDITERRRAEAALEESRQQLEARVRERTAELQASEEWIRRVADAVPVLIGYVDAERRYRFANKRYEEWFGLVPEHILGRLVSEVLGSVLDAEVERHIEAALAGREVEHELSLAAPDGRRVEALVTYRPHFGARGEVLGYFILGQDVTERKQAEAILRQGQKMQAVGQLSGGLAHDFNNLLTIIVGNLALARERSGRSRKVHALINPALDAARRGAALVRRLLAFARQQPIDPKIHNAKQLIAGMEELLQRTLGSSIEIGMRLSGRPCLIRTDPNELENAVLNLAINSRDAMPEGGKLEISVETLTLDPAAAAIPPDLAPGEYVIVAVSDAGSGMPQEVVERAFEPFFTTKQFGRGSGLGLSMVYGFARRSGGKVEIESETGKGTTVRIYLPRVTEKTAAEAKSEQPGARAPRGRERVLVVEDERQVRELTAKLLRGLGYQVLDAADGKSGLELLARSGAVDLLLTDVELRSGMSGIELAHTARRRLPALKVLLMSGYPDKALEQAGAGEGRYELIAKPFEKTELARRVRAALDRAAEPMTGVKA
jgi:PAS domain S-box-containing protein